MRKPTERRLYELARKHCGNQVAWKIKLDKLKAKMGITSQLKTLRFNLRKIADTNHLPEYNVSIEDDIVLFSRKEAPKEKYVKLPLHVKKKEIEQLAKPGESYLQAKERILKLKKAIK